MSLNSLAASRVARELTTGAQQRGFGGVSDDALGPRETDVQNALSALVEYVPAETVTLYLASLATLPVLSAGIPSLTAWRIYLLFAVLTPTLFALIYAGKRRAVGQPRSPGLKEWPWWPMVASTIAFLAWGLAVPGGPVLTPDPKSSQAIGGLLAIFVSVLLGVGGRFFAPRP